MTRCPCGNERGEARTDLTLIEPILEKYRDIPGSLITVLQQVQSVYGYLPKDAIKAISQALNIKVAKIMGVITFYAQFRLNPIGKHLIMVCQGTACHVNGSEKIAEALEEELAVKEGETTPDKLFTLENVACLGCCSMAPVMMIQTAGSNEVYGPLTPKSAAKIVKDIRRREGGSAK
ncbi:MAG: NADH-quinone oxidoreductase subunit NuoE [Bacillota bacterium]|nr:NADH-quinone oxidoreductase subunit NuoE [Bacillota bacterium]